MKRLAHSAAWYLYWTLAILLALVAALLVSVKLLFQDISAYRADIEKQLSQVVQAQVRIGEIDGSWRGWIPQLSLKNLSVAESAKHPSLAVGLLDAKLEIDPAVSIKRWAPVFSVFQLDGLTIHYDLRQQRAGLPKPSAPNQSSSAATSAESSKSNAGVLAFLLNQSSINITGTRIELISKTGDTISLSPIDLKKRHDGQLHQLNIDATLATATNNAKVSFVAEVEGSPTSNPVAFYMNIEGVDETLINPWLALAELQVDSFKGNQQLWGETYRGRLRYISAKTAVSDFQMGPYALQSFDLNTALLRRDQTYQLQIVDLNLKGADKQIRLPKISLDLHRKVHRLLPAFMSIDRVDLARLVGWAQQQPFVPDNVRSILQQLAPAGVVENIYLNWENPQILDGFALSADMRDVDIQPWGDVPGIQGINGLLQMNKSGGAIHLVSQDFKLNFPTLFRQGWDYSQADGIVMWYFKEKGVDLVSQLLHVSNDSVSGSGRFSFYMPYDRDEQTFLNLQIGLADSDGKKAPDYIPPEEVGEEIYDWLAGAIHSGHIKKAGLVLNGTTRRRLPDYQEPAVQLFLDVGNAVLEYQEGWPKVENADAFVYYRNGELVAEASKGRIYETDIGYAWAYLPASTDRLLLNGVAAGQAEDIHKLLTTSELRQNVGDALQGWQMSGAVGTLLEVDLPLIKGAVPKVNITAQLDDGAFISTAEELAFTDIQGQVNFSSDQGLSAEKISAKLFEQPVSARIEAKPNKTQIYLNSAITSQRLGEWLDLPIEPLAQGRLKYQARLDLCPEKSCDQLVISSDLTGMAINAFTPLSKAAEESRALTIVSDLGTKLRDQRSVVRFNYAEQLRGVILGKDRQFERGRFTFGGQRPQVPEQLGIWIDGQLEQLDIAEIQGLAAGFKAQSQTPSVAFNNLNLTVDKLLFKQYALHNLNIDVSPNAAGQQVKLLGDEVVGSIWVPNNKNAIYRVELERLQLASVDEAETAASGASEEQDQNQSQNQSSKQAKTSTVDELAQLQLKPSELPKLDLSINHLVWRDKLMGQWRLQLRPEAQAARIENLHANMLGTELKGEIRWQQGEQDTSDITLKLESEDFNPVFEAWGLQEAVELKQIESYIQLSWPGAPWDFSLAQTGGKLQFDTGKGRLIDVGQSGNLLRVFGILNLQSLGRRLRLDFSDLFKSGVAFDDMKADYTITKGIAQTGEPFMMLGPSANLVMQGKLNLVDETVDKEIEVALPVTNNIPLVSVLLGAPQVAGAVFLIDKLIGDPLARFTKIKYNLSGDWGNPDIDLKTNKAAAEESEEVTEESDNG